MAQSRKEAQRQREGFSLRQVVGASQRQLSAVSRQRLFE
jgi:hypothetical protein